MVFVTFIEILMPSSSLKKYTKLILGLLVMTIILQPIFSILNKDFSISLGSIKYQNQLDSSYIKKQTADYSESQAKEVTDLYKKNLENQIKEQVLKETGDREVEVKINVIEDNKSEYYGQINSINITVGKQSKTVDKVEKVVIGPGENKNQKNVIAGYDGLRNKISALYDIDKNKVEINIKN